MPPPPWGPFGFLPSERNDMMTFLRRSVLCATLTITLLQLGLLSGQTSNSHFPVPAQRATLGPITIALDATEAPRKILHARLNIPTTPGPLTLLYPKWIPGEHGPTGPITDLAGLRITAGGKPVAWSRDAEDMYAFHVEVPAGAKAIEVAFDFLSPVGEGRYSAGASATANLVVLSWNQLVLYPAGGSSDAWTYSVRL